LILTPALFLTACGASPVTPTAAATHDTSSTGPALNATPARVFAFSTGTPLSSPVMGYTAASRFFLNDDGTFALVYPASQYRGRYKQTADTITFDWEGWSLAGPWGATGKLAGDQLTVEYNVVMQLTDFEDAVYTLQK
jgi:hypothetical protein